MNLFPARLAMTLAVGSLMFVPAVYSQKPATGSTPTTGNTPSAPTGNVGTGTTTGVNGSRGTFGSNQTSPNNNGGFNDQSRPIFLSGSVMFDDGSTPNSNIRIERVCSGNPRLEAHTDSKGRFSFQLGGDISSGIADADASSSNFGSYGNNSRNSNSGWNSQQSGFGDNSGRSLLGCELRAAYPGYISEVVDLSMRHSMDDPKVGTIILHHLGNVQGTTISLTTAQVPKPALKDFEKGNQLIQKGKFEDAEQKLISATTAYPKFAEAWFALGQVQQRLNKLDEAQKAYTAALAADSRYVSPYDQLALLAAQQGKWEDTARYSKQATDLNPVEFPSSFWYNALANYNLKKNAEAEKSAQALVKLDSRHRFPQAQVMLSEFAANRGDLDEAASHIKAFLAAAPNAKNADQMKGELARIEQARATQAKNAPAPAAH